MKCIRFDCGDQPLCQKGFIFEYSMSNDKIIPERRVDKHSPNRWAVNLQITYWVMLMEYMVAIAFDTMQLWILRKAKKRAGEIERAREINEKISIESKIVSLERQLKNLTERVQANDQYRSVEEGV